MDDGPARLLAFVILFFFDAYFAGVETSLATVNKLRIAAAAEDGDKAAVRVQYLLDNFDKTLSTLLIGNNIAHTAIATLATVVMYDVYKGSEVIPDYAVPLCTLITAVATFFISEMIPKCFAKAMNERFARATSRSMIFFVKVLTPLSFIFSAMGKAVSAPFRKKAEDTPTVTEEELYDLIETYVEENDIDEDTEELVQNAIEFSESTAREVMTPWDKVLTINADMPTEQAAALVRESVHSRLPVLDGDGRVIGTLRIRKFLQQYLTDPEHVDIRELMHKPEFIPVSTPVDDLLTAMSEKRAHLAYIKSGDDILGILTVEDILEELVGEIYDEEDEIGGEGDA